MNSDSVYLYTMTAPDSDLDTYPVDPDAWRRGMERIRQLSPWQQALMEPQLVAEALEDEETKFLVDGWKF